MSNLIFDYADIRSRMLGDDKPAPKAEKPTCHRCDGKGWMPALFYVGFMACHVCGNPEAKPCP